MRDPCGKSSVAIAPVNSSILISHADSKTLVINRFPPDGIGGMLSTQIPSGARPMVTKHSEKGFAIGLVHSCVENPTKLSAGASELTRMSPGSASSTKIGLEDVHSIAIPTLPRNSSC